MSYDRLLNQVCPHLVVEEALFVSSDRVTVRPLRPIAAVASVRVRLNGEISVPSSGVHLPATTTGSKGAPFNIQGGVNDQLVLRVGDGPFQTIKAPSGNRLTAQQIVDHFNQTARDVVFDVSSKRQVRIKTSVIGPSASLFIRGEGSTVAPILGLSVNRAWRGRTTVPGWTLINDPNTLGDRPTRLVVFDNPLKGFEDYVEINYTTIREECRRCGGTGVENDWRYDQRDVVKVRDADLLEQEILKIVYTVLGSNPFNPWYGTKILSAIGKKLTNNGIVQNMIVSDIYESFRRWQSIKKQQEESVGQEVTDMEYPFRLLSVDLEQSTEDPTVIFVTLVVQNRSNQPLQITRGIRVPFPEDLLGDSSSTPRLIQ